MLELALPDPWIFLGMALLIAFSAFMQGVGGVGFAMFAAPVAAMVAPQMVPGTLLTLGGLVSLLTALRERRDILWTSAGTALAGRAAGTLMAAFTLTWLAPRFIGLLFAALILLAVGLSLAGLRIVATRRTVTIAGIVSGLMGTLTSVGAPPLAIAFQHSPPPNLRATLGITLFCGSAMSLTMLAMTGHYTLPQFMMGLALLPFLVAGFALSGRVRQHLSHTLIRRFVLAFCTCSAIGLIVKAVTH